MANVDYVYIPVRHADRPAIIDVDDYPVVEPYLGRWRIYRHSRSRTSKVIRNDWRKSTSWHQILLSRQILDVWERNIVIIHKNDDMFDCRKSNLDIITRREHQSKVKKNKQSAYVGVSPTFRSYHVQIYSQRYGEIVIGSYNDEKVAAQVYDYTLWRHGQSPINFPNYDYSKFRAPKSNPTGKKRTHNLPKGVHYNPAQRKPYKAILYIKQRTNEKYIGSYATIAEAKQAYDEAKEYHERTGLVPPSERERKTRKTHDSSTTQQTSDIDRLAESEDVDEIIDILVG